MLNSSFAKGCEQENEHNMNCSSSITCLRNSVNEKHEQ